MIVKTKDVDNLMYIKKTLLLLFSLLICLPVFSQNVNRAASSLAGPIGTVVTPVASVVPNKSANVGIWKNTDDRGLNSLYLSYGLKNWLEVGLNSTLLDNSKTDFLFKLNSNVIPISKKLPTLAFGADSFDSFIVASYSIYPIMLSIGGMLNENNIFASINARLSRQILLQAEIKDTIIGLGIRGQLNRLQLSLLYQDDNDANSTREGRWFLGVSLNLYP